MKFFVSYFGCRSNQAEVQDWVIDLENEGFELTTNQSEAKFAILNTCSVTQKAEKDVLKFIEKNYKKTNIKWYIAGCSISNNRTVLSEKYKSYGFFDNEEKKAIVYAIKKDFSIDNTLIYHSSFRSRKFLKIQDGCNHRCSYCIVPSLRGKPKSLSIDDIKRRAEYFSSLGYKELILTGINLSSYGYDLFPRINILDVLKILQKIKGIDLIRLSSLDPRYLDFQFVKGLSKIDKLALSFHFSFQSGSNSVLKRMNRNSKAKNYLKTMDEFKKFFPDANYGSDFIVGFPGETEKEFSETVDFIEASNLNYLHVFPYSPRPGTKSAVMEDQIPFQIAKRRAGELKEINKNLKFKYCESNIDKIVSGILIEESKDFSLVVTSNYLNVKIPPSKGLKKKKIFVQIKSLINENLCEGIHIKNYKVK